VVNHELLTSLGLLFLAGLLADQIGRNTWLPRVTLLLLCGLAVGGPGLNLVPPQLTALYPVLSTVALTMVAFLLGGSLKISTLRQHGGAILWISLSVVVGTVLIVTIGLVLMGAPAGMAVILATIATATAPAATNDVIRQSGIENGFTRTLSGIVAIDDAWGLIAFSIAIVFATQMLGASSDVSALHAAREIGGAVLLGATIGIPAAFLTGRLSEGEPLETEALGLVFLTAGLAVWLNVSFLISGMVTGAIIVNFAAHHTRAFHEIEHIQWPFMVLFFILAGASLEIATAIELGALGLAFVVLRIASRLLGGWVGSALAEVPVKERAMFGWALLPQAGVAIGMALVAAQQFPHWSSQIMAITVGSTVIFEILGPIACLLAIRRSAK
jgi:Kef-type K+ transport system membrane component KefB